jgi:hypothetical protein
MLVILPFVRPLENSLVAVQGVFDVGTSACYFCAGLLLSRKVAIPDCELKTTR